ncbi:MAG: portal protein, partial [Bacillota bacterium]|nr:portal protein [Bacillota bacterium]
YNDLFLMLALGGDKQMTAREVSERHEEKLLSVGPVVERLQPELLDVAIDRTYNIMDRHGLLPKPPRELEGADIEIEYISLLAQAQRMVGISSLEQTAYFAAGLAGVWPEARAMGDARPAVDVVARMAGAPSAVVLAGADAGARRAAVAGRGLAVRLPAGVRVFKKILADGGMFTTSFTGNSTTFFNEGARNAALRIFAAICEASPDAVKSLILDDRGKNNGRE